MPLLRSAKREGRRVAVSQKTCPSTDSFSFRVKGLKISEWKGILLFSSLRSGSSHTKSFRCMKRLLFVLAAATIGNQLWAQSDSVVLLDDVVVTASKYPVKASRTGKVLTIITREQLASSGGRDLAQVLAEQSGLYIAGANSNTGKDKSVYLRGSRPEHTLILLDGIPVYDPSGVGGQFDIRNLPLSCIERIEVVKGGQSTLYGSDAIAGVINIITRQASRKAKATNLSAGYGSFANWRVQAGWQGAGDKWDYRLQATAHSTRGINETTQREEGQTDRDGFRQQGFQAGFGYRPSEKVLLRPFVRYSRIRGAIDQGAFTDELDYTYNQDSWQAGMRNRFLLGKSTLNVLYQFNQISRLYTDDSLLSRNGFDTWSQGRYEGSEQLADLYLVSPLRLNWRLTFGLEGRASGSDQSYESWSAWGPYKSSYSGDSLNQRQLSFYSAIQGETPIGFQIEAGIRGLYHSAWGGHLIYSVNPSWRIRENVKLFVPVVLRIREQGPAARDRNDLGGGSSC
jgi:vitamin B12 transporter